MFNKSKRLPVDMTEECERRYSSASKIDLNECIDSFERNHDYRELLYAVHALVNSDTLVQDIHFTLRLGEDYILRNMNEEVGAWKNIPTGEYLEGIKEMTTDDRVYEKAKFVAYCLCGAWAEKHKDD